MGLNGGDVKMPEEVGGLTGGIIGNLAVVSRAQLVVAPLAGILGGLASPVAHAVVALAGVGIVAAVGMKRVSLAVIGAGIATAGVNYFVPVVPDLSGISLAFGIVVALARYADKVPVVGKFIKPLSGL